MPHARARTTCTLAPPCPPLCPAPQHGNAKYEHSILRAAGGLEWKVLVEEAAAKFREAGERLPACLPACLLVCITACIAGCLPTCLPASVSCGGSPCTCLCVRGGRIRGPGTAACLPCACRLPRPAPATHRRLRHVPLPPCLRSGAHATDIRNALKGHPMAEEMADIIGPEPEPEAAAAPKEEAAAKEAPKGLPSLDRKAKKKESA